MKASKKALFAVVAALVALSLLVVGCGGNADDGAADGSKVVKIAVGVPLTDGDVAFGVGILRGVEVAVAQANDSAEAKELGLMFEIVEGDDRSDPNIGTTVANQFVADADVVGVVGHFNSGVSRPASAVYNDAGIVMITPGSTAPDITKQGFDNIFRTCTTDDLQGPYGAEAMIDLGLKKAFIVDNSTPYGEGIAAEFSAKYEEIGGAIVGEDKTSEADVDFTALITKIKATNPDVVYFGGTYNGGGALFSKQMKDAGLKVPLMGGDGIVADAYIELAGPASEGDYATSVGYPLDLLPGGQDFTAAYKEMFPSETIGNFDAYAYDAAQAIIKAVLATAEADGVDSLTTAEGKKAIVAGVAASDFDGATGNVAFDEKGDTKAKIITVYKVVSGAWVGQKK